MAERDVFCSLTAGEQKTRTLGGGGLGADVDHSLGKFGDIFDKTILMILSAVEQPLFCDFIVGRRAEIWVDLEATDAEPVYENRILCSVGE